MGLIALNVLAVCLESVQSLSTNYEAYFLSFELISVIIFTVEYVFRVWTSIENEKYGQRGALWGRLRFMINPLVITDFVVIFPFYLGLLGVGLDLRFLRVIRLRRGFRLTRYAGGLGLLNDVFQQERRLLGSALFATFLLVVAASSALYIAETSVQPEVFSSIPATMWWAINTLTTVGASGAVPATGLGKFFAALMSIFAVVLVGLFAGIMGAGFSAAARRRRLQYERALLTKVHEGHSFQSASAELAILAKTLALRPTVVKSITTELEFRVQLKGEHCQQCGKPI
jgi:voltage-gated potassium channel